MPNGMPTDTLESHCATLSYQASVCGFALLRTSTSGSMTVFSVTEKCYNHTLPLSWSPSHVLSQLAVNLVQSLSSGCI